MVRNNKNEERCCGEKQCEERQYYIDEGDGTITLDNDGTTIRMTTDEADFKTQSLKVIDFRKSKGLMA